MNSIINVRPFTFGLFAVLTPGVAGALLGWYFVKNVKKSEDVAVRVVILTATFMVVAFLDVYAATYSVTSAVNKNMLLMPNLTFAVGLMLYIIIKFSK